MDLCSNGSLSYYCQHKQVWFLLTKRASIDHSPKSEMNMKPVDPACSVFKVPLLFFPRSGVHRELYYRQILWVPTPSSLCWFNYSSSFYTNRHDSSWGVGEPLGKYSVLAGVFPLPASQWEQEWSEVHCGTRVRGFSPCLSLPPLLSVLFLSYHQISTVVTFPDLAVLKMFSSPFSSLSYIFCNCFCFAQQRYQSRQHSKCSLHSLYY